MKKKWITVIVLMLCLIVAYGGSGVNVYFYCCDDCRSQGTMAITEDKCCEIHHHHDSDVSASHIRHECDALESTDACGVERISVNWNSYVHQINLQPVFSYLDNHIFLINKEILEPFGFTKSVPLYSDTQKPPNLGEDTYFDLLNTLII